MKKIEVRTVNCSNIRNSDIFNSQVNVKKTLALSVSNPISTRKSLVIFILKVQPVSNTLRELIEDK